MEGPHGSANAQHLRSFLCAWACASLNHPVKQKGSTKQNSQAKTSSGYRSSTKSGVNVFPWDSRLFHNQRFGRNTRSLKIILFPEAGFVFVLFKNPYQVSVPVLFIKQHRLKELKALKIQLKTQEKECW